MGFAEGIGETGVDEAEGFHEVGTGAAAGIEHDDAGIGEAIGANRNVADRAELRAELVDVSTTLPKWRGKTERGIFLPVNPCRCGKKTGDASSDGDIVRRGSSRCCRGWVDCDPQG